MMPLEPVPIIMGHGAATTLAGPLKVGGTENVARVFVFGPAMTGSVFPPAVAVAGAPIKGSAVMEPRFMVL